jgi:hypothetical protein
VRVTRWLLGIGTSLSVLGAVAAGCGGSTTGSSPAHDSGTDVTTEAATEAAPEAAPEVAPDVAEAASDGPCVPDANINNIAAPDAALGDAGATAAGCIACFEMYCQSTLIAQCNKSCQCVSAFEGFGACLASGKSLTTCGGMFATGAGIPITPTELGCAIPCAQPSVCGVTFPTGDSGGGDSGSSDTGTVTDSATDGG